jgi:hypothetical protein
MRVFKQRQEANPRGLLTSEDGVVVDIRYSPGLVSYETEGTLYLIPRGDTCRYKGRRGIPLDINQAYRPDAYGKRLPQKVLDQMRIDLVAAYAAAGKSCVFPWECMQSKHSFACQRLVLTCLILALILAPFTLGWSFFLDSGGGPFGDFAGPTLPFFLISFVALLAGVLVLVFGRSPWRWLLLLLVLPSAFSLLYHLGKVVLHP